MGRVTSLGLMSVLVALTFCASACTAIVDSAANEPEIPDSPLAEATVDCMQEQGFEASILWDGSIAGPSDVSSEQTLQWSAAMTTCVEATGYGSLAALSPNQVGELYQQELAEYACLRDAGFSPEAPPSQQTYMDTFASAEQYYAFKEVFDPLSMKEAQEIVAVCPPPTWFLDVVVD